MINLVTQHLKVEPVKVDLEASVEVSLDSQVVLMTLEIFSQVSSVEVDHVVIRMLHVKEKTYLHRIRISFEDAVFGTKKNYQNFVRM